MPAPPPLRYWIRSCVSSLAARAREASTGSAVSSSLPVPRPRLVRSRARDAGGRRDRHGAKRCVHSCRAQSPAHPLPRDNRHVSSHRSLVCFPPPGAFPFSGSVLAYIESDGSVGSASLEYLGEVSTRPAPLPRAGPRTNRMASTARECSVGSASRETSQRAGHPGGPRPPSLNRSLLSVVNSGPGLPSRGLTLRLKVYPAPSTKVTHHKPR